MMRLDLGALRVESFATAGRDDMPPGWTGEAFEYTDLPTEGCRVSGDDCETDDCGGEEPWDTEDCEPYDTFGCTAATTL